MYVVRFFYFILLTVQEYEVYRNLRRVKIFLLTTITKKTIFSLTNRKSGISNIYCCLILLTVDLRNKSYVKRENLPSENLSNDRIISRTLLILLFNFLLVVRRFRFYMERTMKVCVHFDFSVITIYCDTKTPLL